MVWRTFSSYQFYTVKQNVHIIMLLFKKTFWLWRVHRWKYINWQDRNLFTENTKADGEVIVNKNRSISHTDSLTESFRNQQGNWKHPVKPGPAKWHPVLQWQTGYWQGNPFHPGAISTEGSQQFLLSVVFSVPPRLTWLCYWNLWLQTEWMQGLFAATGSADIIQGAELCEGPQNPLHPGSEMEDPWRPVLMTHAAAICKQPLGEMPSKCLLTMVTLPLPLVSYFDLDWKKITTTKMRIKCDKEFALFPEYEDLWRVTNSFPGLVWGFYRERDNPGNKDRSHRCEGGRNKSQASWDGMWGG